MPPVCKLKFSFGEQRCVRTRGHLGLHSDHTNPRRATVQWGGNETEKTT